MNSISLIPTDGADELMLNDPKLTVAVMKTSDNSLAVGEKISPLFFSPLGSLREGSFLPPKHGKNIFMDDSLNNTLKIHY